MANVEIENLQEAIREELTLYSNQIIDGVKKVAKKSMKKLVDRTKEDAPMGKRSRHYKDNISSKKLSENERSISLLWYVKGSDYRLSHLLNNGHQLRDGGRYDGTKFITNASNSILEEYENDVKEVIENG